ncbi:hypothetical protein AVEN_85261-1 [Araneus ventricosus]|uniref:Uncharacterized protein n=1 Tax=Araneus ventricosus TaxID=182803 RepID=A0A4Y2X6U9_ARAVE|nr:hypothetical protein AVEN_82914-1 [Araneus ventricosus]GBO45486.1 hypothetical protein AVEN_85261-1 [Araneus ventricosus]
MHKVHYNEPGTTNIGSVVVRVKDHQLTQGCGSATEPSQSESIYPLVDLSEERNEHKEDPPTTFEADSSSNER